MTDLDLIVALNNRNALIIHFSHYAKMREGGVFPKDLKDAITNHEIWPLSCVVIWPGHEMDLPGSIGVIFKLNSVSNILSVLNDDSGSYYDVEKENDCSGGVILCEDSFEQTFQVNIGQYNEWRVQNADVFGIFVNNPSKNYAKKKLTINEDKISFEDIGLTTIFINEVFESFPGLLVYTMGSNGVEEVKKPI